ncbi:MAG: hypothetical protein KJO41_00590 [Bacteroidia bacterium]|nr:hypothetical protein [Bacteroidia bacterium]NND25270.1 hypothetical protein [Flavobacteriaceae bacterium]MBT8277466.1 hypothetical protein [Bacteroidia bacterium]NNK61085.1 hypothetical protein [Flavobacteriaceae bacterium]NNL32822.1 hypothetical protein [Flavobacteriaceae bacterium]
MAFNVHLTRHVEFDAETYYEILPEELEEPETPEELAELMESIDALLATNKAYNETQKNNEFEDEAFQNTMDKIRNRAAKDYEIDDHISESNGTNDTNDDLDSFEEINELIDIRSQDKRASLPSNSSGNHKNSRVSFSLVNRTDEYLPPPIYLCEESGKIVINITVDSHGNVTDTDVNSSSTSSNGCLIDHAIEYAKASKFNADNSKANQLGTITFYFRGKS